MLTKKEIHILRITLIMEWEYKQGIIWVVDGINIPDLIDKLEKIENNE